MKKYRIVSQTVEVSKEMFPENPEFKVYSVQMKFLCFWITIKAFVDDDPDFALQLAQELLDMLNQE